MEAEEEDDHVVLTAAASSSSPSASAFVSSPSSYVSYGSVLTGDPSTHLLGHGTRIQAGPPSVMVATVAGVKEQINQLISVRAVNSRYAGDIGDVVVGRVLEVGEQRWKVDIGSRQHASLLLAAIHLPGGQLRRRTAADSLSIRDYFSEGSLLSCEVQKVRSDNSIALHTRSERYGDMKDGCLIKVNHLLIKRCRQHFQTIAGAAAGIEIILGINGWIFIGLKKETETTETQQQQQHTSQKTAAEAVETTTATGSPPPPRTVSLLQRASIARIYNSIAVLSAASLLIYDESISAVYQTSIQLGLSVKAMKQPENLSLLTDAVINLSKGTQTMQESEEG